MAKREISSPDASEHTSTKRVRQVAPFNPIKIATASVAANVDTNTPFSQLNDLVSKNVKPQQEKGASVVFWMRMGDLRIRDNRALSRASEQAHMSGLALIALFVISPQDYIAHDTGVRRIDFILRNLHALKEAFSELHIPFYVISQSQRQDIPSFVVSFCDKHCARNLYANFQYEVDELRRDIKVFKLGNKKNIQVHLEHDKCLVDPGILVSKQGKAYAVYSPYQKTWISTLNSNIPRYLEDCSIPKPNRESVRSLGSLASLFDTPIPTLDEFKLEASEQSKMREVWPEGEEAASRILQKFLETKSHPSHVGAISPFSVESEESIKYSRILKYGENRDRTDSDTTSRLSAYLTSGVISARTCARATMLLLKSNKVESDRTSGVGRWLQELAWRDFYVNVLVSFPRVSMGRPYLEKFAEVVWENHQSLQNSNLDCEDSSDDGEILKRWKAGMTGVPIVDAAMRCINEMGWVHNRARMITAMYLTKDLMIDWRVGERYFMEKLIDGDLASNNGGWQWCASTGVDPCPYFRIFNPYSQSLKADPTGNFIRHWVPELSKLGGHDLHNPSGALADKLGYPRPIISHSAARERALRRYKNPGEV
ncbi:hypothetical protein BDN70DRAFT_873193 [Pholiota conissans]|uniref:Photolyase/cryptochrome alpha/beta domain-containing protein n=1 Tax=Pholiota conissans TaxID=109636 RepID=A0A9P5ZAB9_9AGAR|nr:hypothetical protein BDN70DRAFT_873193 [Pholiota conissans]